MKYIFILNYLAEIISFWWKLQILWRSWICFRYRGWINSCWLSWWEM